MAAEPNSFVKNAVLFCQRSEDVKNKDDALDRAKEELTTARSLLEQTASELRDSVGKNIRRKIFPVGGGRAVVVQLGANDRVDVTIERFEYEK